MRLPKGFGAKTSREIENPTSFFAPYTIHMLDLGSFTRTADNGFFMATNGYNSIEPAETIFQEPISHETWGMETMFFPLISLDGYNIMLIENFNDQHEKMLVNKIHNYSYPSIDDASKLGKVEIIHSFGLDQVKLLLLTIKGLEQYEKACLAMDRFDLLVKYKEFLDSWCDGDLKNVK